MTIDHTGLVLFSNNVIMRGIGRIAFPIFCFLLTEGYIHTRDIRKYLLRLFIFAIISEVFFDMPFYNTYFDIKHQNVFITLFLGLLAIYSDIVSILLFLAICVAAYFIRCDYGVGGILIIMTIFRFRDRLWLCALICALIIWLLYGPLEFFALLAFVPIALYNGKKGPGSLKYAFYAYYPLHLLVIRLIADYR